MSNSGYLGSRHFLAVVGSSGCGKSSLIKTGLIAGLEAGYLATAGTHWRIVEIRPGNQPFKALAAKLFHELHDVLSSDYTPDTLQQTLRQGSLALHELLAEHPLPNNAQLLIICDQFEEIFRYAKQSSAAEAQNFVSLLLASSKPYPLSTTKLSHSMYVVITMRSDFLGDCTQFSGLAEAINQALYLTPCLDSDQLRAAIEEPAFLFDGEIEPALVTQLLEDVHSNRDRLPLLQHLLMRLWDLANNQNPVLTLSNYDAIGGLTNALSSHADEIYNSLSDEQKHIAEIIFRSLTERTDAQPDTRRPTPLVQITELTGVSDSEVIAVIDVYSINLKIQC
jgi:energy-coupling factor transporter ATP-binding protein EcfA2